MIFFKQQAQKMKVHKSTFMPNNRNPASALYFPAFLGCWGQPAVLVHKRKQKPCWEESDENINHILVDD
jgi:hypothetical protein